MNKGIAIAGNLIVDNVKMCDVYPESGMLTNIREVSRCIGGCAGNTIADLAIIDPSLKLQCIGMVGSDADGVYVKELLTKLGVDVSGVKTTEEAPTSFTDVMTSIANKQRTFFQARGANACFSLSDIDFDHLEVDIFHIGYALLLDAFDKEDPEYGTVMARALAMAQSKGIKTSLDVVSENSDRFSRIVTPSLRYCNYAILNEVEASMVAGIPIRDEKEKILEENIKAICSVFFDKGVKDLVCIHSPEGGWSMAADGSFVGVPSVNVPKDYIKGKVGAGDAFCAGMLYSLYKGFDLEYSLHVAGASAAANLSEKNSIDGLRPFAEMMELDARYPGVKTW